MLLTGTAVHMVNIRGKNCHSTEYSHMLYNVRNIFKSFYNRIYSSNLYLGTFISLSFKTGKGSKIDISEAFTTTHVYRTKKMFATQSLYKMLTYS